MSASAAAWPDTAIVQLAVGQLPWGHMLALTVRPKDSTLPTSLPSIEQIERELGGEDSTA